MMIVNNQKDRKMHKLIFKNDKAKTLTKMLEWSMRQERHKPYTRGLNAREHGLWLVKDDGIYLMSPTAENFTLGKEKNTVVYAQGYKPTKANKDTLWDKTHAISGDDFAEFVALLDDQKCRIIAGGDITIELSETELGIFA